MIIGDYTALYIGDHTNLEESRTGRFRMCPTVRGIARETLFRERGIDFLILSEEEHLNSCFLAGGFVFRINFPSKIKEKTCMNIMNLFRLISRPQSDFFFGLLTIVVYNIL